MPRRQWNDGMEIDFDDLSAISSSLEIELYERVIYELMNRQQGVVFGDSFYVSYVNSTTVQVKLGNGLQYDNTQVDPEPKARLLYVASNTNKTITTPDGTHNRIDIVSIKADRAVIQTDTRNMKDVSSGVVTPTTENIESDWSSDLLVTAGTPSASPAVPSTPAGYIKLAEILVTTSTGIANQAAITDKRPRYQKPTSWKQVVAKTAAYTMDSDDDIITGDVSGGAFSITLLPVAGMTGKEIKIIKIDSSGTSLTIQANGSELINGANTQALAVQYEALNLYCDGTAWYIN